MARRVGVDENTGKLLVGWPHVAQSLSKIVTTAYRERVQRRDLGSPIPGMIDKPQNEEQVLRFFMSVALAVEPRQMAHSIYGEPDFKLLAIGADISVPGEIAVNVVGFFYEEGRQIGERRTLRVVLPTS